MFLSNMFEAFDFKIGSSAVTTDKLSHDLFPDSFVGRTMQQTVQLTLIYDQ